MSVADLLLGYDAREDWLEFHDAWSAERRQSHLLRQGIVKPLSVDSDAWPSVFELVPDLVRPDWTGYVQDLWEDLEALKGAVRKADSLEAKPLSWIAVALVSVTASKTMLAVWQDRVQAVAPPRITDLNARLVGYDVADYFLLSSLTNCGASRWVDPPEWSPKLNEYHLFQDPDTASRFKAEADRQVPDHAPFFVFALWVIEVDHHDRGIQKTGMPS